MFFEIPSEEGQKREEVETNQNKIKSFLQSFTPLFSDSIYHFPLQNYIVFFGHFSRATPCIAEKLGPMKNIDFCENAKKIKKDSKIHNT